MTASGIAVGNAIKGVVSTARDLGNRGRFGARMACEARKSPAGNLPGRSRSSGVVSLPIGQRRVPTNMRLTMLCRSGESLPVPKPRVALI